MKYIKKVWEHIKNFWNKLVAFAKIKPQKVKKKVTKKVKITTNNIGD